VQGQKLQLLGNQTNKKLRLPHTDALAQLSLYLFFWPPLYNYSAHFEPLIRSIPNP